MSIRGVTTSENEAFLGIRLPNFLIDPDEGKSEREASSRTVFAELFAARRC